MDTPTPYTGPAAAGETLLDDRAQPALGALVHRGAPRGFYDDITSLGCRSAIALNQDTPP